MRQRISVTLKRLPATADAFTALVVILDGEFDLTIEPKVMDELDRVVVG